METKLGQTQSLCLCALISGITGLICFLDNYLGVGGLIIALIIPLLSSLFTNKVKIKYVFLYILVSCLLVFYSLQTMLFSLLPSLVSGMIMGLFINKKINGMYVIFLSCLVLVSFQIISIYLIKWIYEVNIIDIFNRLFKLELLEVNLYYYFIYLISLIESSISYIVISNEIKKINSSFDESTHSLKNCFIICILLIISSLFCHYINQGISYLLYGFSLYFIVFLFYYLFQDNQKTFRIILFALLIGGIILSIVILSHYPYDIFYILFAVPLCILFSSLAHFLIKKVNK
jgi:hypothetical protein